MAQTPVEAEDSIIDESQSFERENPLMDFEESSISPVGVGIVPSFIHRAKNRISMNGADWSKLRRELELCTGSPMSAVNILHIGDSHIQADFATRVIRDSLQLYYGNAGRGLIVPLRLSGTNQPNNYSFTSTSKWNMSKLLKPTGQPVGFTGLALTSTSETAQITVSTSDRDENYDPFSCVVIYHSGKIAVRSVSSPEYDNLWYNIYESPGATNIWLGASVRNVTIDIMGSNKSKPTVYGVSLSGNRPGIYYHTIGINGATFSAYASVETLGSGTALLNPRLIIISLGANEAFGSSTTAAVYSSIHNMVTNLRRSIPDAQILLVTPMECQRRDYKTVIRRNRKGRKYTVRKPTGDFSKNTKIENVRETILRYGRDHGIPTYDWYDVAGGEDVSQLWVDNGLFASDRVHHSVAGYALHGRLLYQALIKALTWNQ